ncbi:malonyl-ACP O-methyltransferase BioC [Clostridiaceae bacterium M8S5]|nr:malonyl-ACP O-methyltransferase BioC [Clostridiaceae bacterium M8S5]
MIDKEKLKRRFSRNAKQYNKYSNVQKIMGDELLNNIRDMTNKANVNNILEIGCGTGYLTKAILKHFPNAHITAVDIAPGMIEHVRNTINNNNISFVCDDIETIALKQKYDLIISNATFQWFNSMHKTIANLLGNLNKNGTMIFSTFGNHTFKELHHCFQETRQLLNIKDIVTPGQSFFSLQNLKNICHDIVTKSNTKYNIDLSEDFYVEYFNSCMNFLYSVKKIGANNCLADSSPLAPQFIEKVMNLYDEYYSQHDKVPATYHYILTSIKKCSV